VYPIGEKFPRGVIGNLNRNQGRRLSAEEEAIASGGIWIEGTEAFVEGNAQLSD
jgi:hypothetical protein